MVLQQWYGITWEMCSLPQVFKQAGWPSVEDGIVMDSCHKQVAGQNYILRFLPVLVMIYR